MNHTASGSLNTSLTAFFFYGDGCNHCAAAEPAVAEIESRYPQVKVRHLEIYHNADNQAQYRTMAAQHGLNDPGIPLFIIGDQALAGEGEIRSRLERVVYSEIQATANCTGIASPRETPATLACLNTTSHVSVPIVVSAALIDSVNPCAFSVLIFLLISIAAVSSRRRMILVGGMYIAAVFILYLVSGIGLTTVFQWSGFSFILSMIGAAIAIILGVVNIIEAAYKEEGFALAISASGKNIIENFIRGVTLPAAFLLGILVGIFELPCTGGVYLAILGLVARDMTFYAGLPYLILYNLVFVLPLILILVFVVFVLPPDRANEWRLKHRRLLRLLIGIVMVILGIIIATGWLL